MIRRTLVTAIVALLFAVLGHAQTYQPIVYQHPTFVNNSGLPCAGCSLYSYQAGTTTAQATFSDCTSGTTNTNPIILGTDGGANICINNLAYKFALIDTSGNIVWTVDNVSGWISSLGNYLPLAGGVLTGPLTGTNGTFGGTLTAGTTNGVLNATACGSVPVPSWCSGSDAGAWINAAFAVSSQVQIPPQASCISYTTPIVIPNSGTLSGASINTPGCLKYTPITGTALTVNSSNSITNIDLVGPGSGTAAVGMLVQGNSDKFSHMFVQTFGTGLQAGNGFYNANFDHIFLNNNGQSLLYGNSLTNAGATIEFYGGSIATTGTFAYNCASIGTGAQITFHGTSFGNCGIDQTGSASNVTIIGSDLETYSTTTALPQITHDTGTTQCTTVTLGVYWLEDGTTTRPAMFQTKGTGSHFVSLGDTLNSQEALSEFALDSGTNNEASVTELGYVGFPYLPSATFSGSWGNGTSTCNRGACTYSGAVAAANYKIGANIVLPAALTGFHGNSTKVQISDNTGTSGNLAKFDANGNITDAGTTAGTCNFAASFTSSVGTPSGGWFCTDSNGKVSMGGTIAFGGSSSASTVTLPSTFATACIGVVTNDNGGSAPAYDSTGGACVSTTQITVTPSIANQTIYWEARGH